MLLPDDVPPFRGDLSVEDATSWLQTLVTATGSFSDSGIFRLLSTKFEIGSSAREWFDGLDDDARTYWTPFERRFRERWIAAPLLQAQEDAKWNAFSNHKLTYEMVFVHDLPDPSTSRDIVATWADHHLQLGQLTNRIDSELIEETDVLLPAFIQAYLQVYARPRSRFAYYCKDIKDIPLEIFKFEWLRHQKCSKEVSQKVDSILVTLGSLRTSTSAAPPSRILNRVKPQSARSDGNLNWEPCSPLTSIVSDEVSEGDISEIATPTPEQTPLPDVTEAIGYVSGEATPEEDTPLPVPHHWRKPTNSVSKKDRIAILDSAIDLILKFETIVLNNQASSVNSAIAVYDRLIGRPSRNRDSRALKQSPEMLWYSIEMIHRYRADDHPLTLHRCRQQWSQIVEVRDNCRTGDPLVVHLKQTSIRQDSYNSCGLHQRQSGGPFMAGAIYIGSSGNEAPVIRSDMTVLFMTLSSYLAECSGDAEFLAYAKQSATCIKEFMLDSGTLLVKDCHINPQNSQEKSKSVISCHLTGVAIEGFSVLAMVSGDETWRTLAISMAEAAMNSIQWHGSDGILSVGSDEKPIINSDVNAYKGLLNRGLMVAFQRNPLNKAFRNLVRSYVNVQCNALLDLSSRRNSYGVHWRGPYVGPYAHAQMAALDTLIAAIGVNT